VTLDHCIEPFPTSIDRDSFGNYLSGFTDGEGCFQLVWKTNTPMIRFTIGLRADDLQILKLIQSFWGCGGILFHKPTEKSRLKWKVNACPACQFYIRTTPELVNIVIPHFEKYPLRAKKARDFLIWKRGVSLAWSVYNRKTIPRTRIYKGQVRGIYRRWESHEVAEFRSLSDTLRNQRKYDTATLVIPPSRNQDQPSLFLE